MTTVVHVIAGLGIGGAERILVDVVRAQVLRNYEIKVVNFLADEAHAEELRLMGIDVVSLGYCWRGGRVVGAIKGVLYLFWLFARYKPDIVHTWLYYADVIGGLVAKIFGLRVIWGIFTGNIESQFLTWNTRVFFKLCARLSSFIPSAVVSVSASGRRSHVAAGYQQKKICFVPTGFSVPDSSVEQQEGQYDFRDSRKVVIGMLGRISKEKDHDLLIRAVGQLQKDDSEVELRLAGGIGVLQDNEELVHCLKREKVWESTQLLGRVSDVPTFLQSLDVFCLITNSEGFPTVVGEAMACGKMCIVSDAGDSRILLGDARQLVPRGGLDHLVTRLRWAVGLGKSGRATVGRQNRARIEKHFAEMRMMNRYHRLYQHVSAYER